ncbi:DASH complex subunit Dad3-domain-containing protein [Nemania sp. NC0429]|nr:DASH complex subunit Dad3-domain-containing protein [Nemania sp. NC0429]
MDQAASNPLLSPPDLSPLEQEVLEEYERLAENMKKCIPMSMPTTTTTTNTASAHSPQLASVLDTMANQPTTAILDGLRELERKTSLVFTLLKASVYSIVLQQEIDYGEQHQQQQYQPHGDNDIDNDDDVDDNERF